MKLQKVIVIGCPGSGKSHFSRVLHELTALPLYHLDMLFWNADKTTVSREVFDNRLRSILTKDRWIIDGNYSRTMEKRLRACDTVFFLDLPTEVCLDGIKARLNRPRTDMPWIETEEDPEFTTYVKSFATAQRPTILTLLEKYPEKQVFIFTTREEAQDYLNQLI